MHVRAKWLAVAQAAILIAAVVAAAMLSRGEDWEQWPLAVLLLAMTVATDAFAIETRQMRISGAHVGLVLAMALLGPAPAVAIALLSTLVDVRNGWYGWSPFLRDLSTFATFTLLGALAMQAVGDTGVSEAEFLLAVFAVFIASNLVNFVMCVGSACLVEGVSLWGRFREWYVPLIPAELATGLLAVSIVAVYDQLGLAAMALCAATLFTFQYLLRELLTSQQRAEDLELRGRQLASLHLGVIGAMIHTLDLRDRMTARHCAAVARYSREIAKELGLSEAEQELVHTAGLLHDIGKFVFPDHILKADVPLTERDWEIIRSHPYQGAKIVSQVDGYGPISEIVLAHHERWDGAGYPRRLSGEEIPRLSRIISVADTYDVMTARDSYREPVSSMEAMRELQRVAGSQLDPEVVDAFISLLARSDIGFRHADNADFDAELALEERIVEYARGPVGPPPA